jgi:hypothetical protein
MMWLGIISHRGVHVMDDIDRAVLIERRLNDIESALEKYGTAINEQAELLDVLAKSTGMEVLTGPYLVELDEEGEGKAKTDGKMGFATGETA